MKFSEQWLREWVSPPVDTGQLAERLTMSGLEVEAIEPAAGGCRGVIVGEVLAVERHPDADKLSLCRVSDGREEFQLVCGAPNVRAGMLVPFARVGAELANGLKIQRAKIRGVESFGMLCSAEQLAMEESSDGLLSLPPGSTVGSDVNQLLHLDGQSLELGLTPNRGDCLGIAGIAREVGVLYELSVSPPALEPVVAQIDRAVTVRLDAPEGCPRYACRVISDVNVGAQSPLWLQEKLRRCGVRSIDPVVDVTNYVMLELGQPMHAFDLECINGGIIVRVAVKGEELALLDGQQLTLNEGDLLIADHKNALAMAGVMGGADSAVSKSTEHVLLESAFFAPLAIAGRARAHGLHTDASHRFERGVDFRLQECAIERATALLLDITGGTPGPLICAEHEESLPPRDNFTLRAARLDRLLGVNVPGSEVSGILDRLGLDVTEVNGDWKVTAPSWRFDLEIEADLIEEVARVHGYDKVPAQRQAGALAIQWRPEARLRLDDAKRRLISLGYQEAITYSFVDPAVQALVEPDIEPIALSNPISADMAVMRTSLWPGLLQALQYNLKRQQSRLRLFESGQNFRDHGGDLQQREALAGVIAGDRMPQSWASEAASVDFFDLKGDVESLLNDLSGRGDYRFESAEHPGLHPGQSARIIWGDKPAGWIGLLHPSVQAEMEIVTNIYLFELDFALISKRNLPKFKGLSKFPEVRRDLAVVVDQDVPASALTDAVREVAGELLQNLMLFDMYRGEHIDSMKKSIALGMVLQHPDRTLTEDEINDLVDNVVKTLAKRHGAVLRN